MSQIPKHFSLGRSRNKEKRSPESEEYLHGNQQLETVNSDRHTVVITSPGFCRRIVRNKVNANDLDHGAHITPGVTASAERFLDSVCSLSIVGLTTSLIGSLAYQAGNV
uniref:Uncharacterized protein n=1 Tax=Megaselia scalaris TaxID=36166 RepID=T1H5J2_MEGSC